MQPTDIVSAARDLYNATGDTYFSDTLMYNWLWQASQTFAKKARVIEATSTVTTAAGTQSYSYPTNALAIKRVTYNGSKLKRVTMRQDDAVTLSNQASSTQGKPVYYTDFNRTIYLRPIPDSALSLVFYYYSNEPQVTSGTQTLLLPTEYHFECVDYLLWRMYAKDQNEPMAELHMKEFKQHIVDAIIDKAKMKRSDSFSVVQDEETLPVTIMGEV